ncbi:MAG: hypothetical protein Q8M22_11480 [Actinomycetota bacterium]|nr:hypothetical protein [Actinomycetota bacterium]
MPQFTPGGQTAMGALDERREVAARKNRRKRRIAAVVVSLLAAGGAYGGWSWWQAQQPKVVTFAAEERWVMEAAGYSFAMPTTPVEESFSENVMGMQMTGTAYTIKSGDDLRLEVLTMQFEVVLGPAAQNGFDGIIDGMAQRSGGTLTSNESFMQGDIERRTAIIELEGERFFVDGFAKGSVVILVTGGVPFDDDNPPDTYQGIVDSVVFV